MTEGRPLRREVSECLVARYRNELWFVSVKFKAFEPGVELLVRESCPFAKHRPVLNVDVKVVVMIVASQRVLVPKPLLADEPRKPVRRLRLWLEAERQRSRRRYGVFGKNAKRAPGEPMGYVVITRKKYEELKALCQTEDESFRSKSRRWFAGNAATYMTADKRLVTTITFGPFIVIDGAYQSELPADYDAALEVVKKSLKEYFQKYFEARAREEEKDDPYDWSLDP